ncbi:hypothetical protein BJ742DRAFT_68858 [Cladochytrium replicatum]|nr:hypothetical protein BJ742DRAFT_68858 [Cladochytrium replicatum]
MHIVAPPTPDHRVTVWTYRVLNTVFFSGIIVANGLARDIFDTKPTDKEDTWITPSGPTFAIWGLIYTTLLAFVIFQLLPFTTDVSNPAGAAAFDEITRRVHGYFLLTCVLNVLWLYIWSRRIVPLAFFVLLLLVVVLSMIYVRQRRLMLAPSVEEAPAQEGSPLLGHYGPILSTPSEHPWWIVLLSRLPFGLYLGWTTAATCVNLFIWLFPIDPENPFPNVPYSIAAVVFLSAIGVVLPFTKGGDVTITLVLAWALHGVSDSKAIHYYPGKEADTMKWVSSTASKGLLVVAAVAVVYRIVLAYRSRAAERARMNA